MCGIFGFAPGATPATFNQVLQDNFKRGGAAFSMFHPATGIRAIIDNPTWEDVTPVGTNVDLESPVLGHFQAPTAQRGPDRHPFQWREWFVAHNGVIHNWAEPTGLPPHDWPHQTDSSIIPLGLGRYGWENLQDLNGSFACWAYNYLEKQTYLFSWVNPIHFSPHAFSSCPFEGSTQLREGLIIKWPNIEEVTTFSAPYHPYGTQHGDKS